MTLTIDYHEGQDCVAHLSSEVVAEVSRESERAWNLRRVPSQGRKSKCRRLREYLARLRRYQHEQASAVQPGLGV